jgi:hypothetical protein
MELHIREAETDGHPLTLVESDLLPVFGEQVELTAKELRGGRLLLKTFMMSDQTTGDVAGRDGFLK